MDKRNHTVIATQTMVVQAKDRPTGVITSVLLTPEQLEWLSGVAAVVARPRSPFARPSYSRALRQVLDWVMKHGPSDYAEFASTPERAE